MDYTNLGALERKKDERDIMLGSVQAPVSIPGEYLPDNSWLQRNFQGQTAFCGEHAGTHFQAILEHQDSPALSQRYSPRYGAIKLKDPKSPVYDGFAIGAGTTMTAIFKWLQAFGADSYEPLGNDVTLPPATYCDPSAVTPAMDADAANQKIKTYAFDALTFEDLRQAIYQNKAVLALIKCDDGFWGTATPTFNTPTYGHFVVLDGYTPDAIRAIDSADPNPAFAVKMIAKQYVVPRFVLESGTAVDVPVEQLAAIVKTAAQDVQAVSQSAMPAPQKETLLEEIEKVVEVVEQIL